MHRTGPLRAGVVLVAAVLVAGCGGTAGTASAPPQQPAPAVAPATDPLEQVVAASEATLAAGSSRFTLNIDVTGAGAPFTMITASGASDFASQSAELEMTMAQAPGAPAQTLRSIMVGGTVYQQPVGQDRWFSIDAGAMGPAQSDPAAQIRQFRNSAKDVREVGTADVRGETMRHFELTLVPPANAGGEAAPLPPGGVPADLYIDGQGRFGRLETRTPAPNGSTAVTTMDFFDYGTPVSVQAPDPATVDPLPTQPPR